MLVENSNNLLYCKKCDYLAKRKGDFKKHLQSKKHNASNAIKIASKKFQFSCPCGKTYCHDSSYYRHRKRCQYKEPYNETKETVPNNDVMSMLHGQKELIALLKDIVPKLNEPASITTNSHNKILNVQMFLTEKCADAMSIQNFAKQLQVTLDDLYKSKMDCITNVVLKSLKPLSLTERPFHCTNSKTKEWFIKDEKEGWEEDNGEKLIKSAEHGIQKKWMNEFETRYPKWMENDQLQEKYVKIAGSTTSELPEKMKLKLLRELACEVPLTNEDMF
tara:strand:+ start:8357 stop:9184 length:828 start_codon:yes stop_codon:yes gene_type:complete